jgi:hypothetical protein
MSGVLAIDPGPVCSAWLLFLDGAPGDFDIDDNADVLRLLRNEPLSTPVIVEKIESFGMPVGREVFDTVWWSGRFAEARNGDVEQLSRRAVKLALCGSARAKDANIRQALLDRYGGSTALGTKRTPGPLYGISKDVWSALAIAVAWTEGAR